jgi:uncharacterized protein YciI
MPLYAVIGFDHPPHSMALRDNFRAEHRAYVQAHDEGIRLAGAFYDTVGNQCGTLIIFEANGAEDVREWYRKEPFYKNDAYKDFHVIEWRLAFNQLERTGWVRDYPRQIDSRTETAGE